MSHISMMKHSENDAGYIQVVTHANNKSELESLGFVDHVDKIKKPAVKKAARAASNDK